MTDGEAGLLFYLFLIYLALGGPLPGDRKRRDRRS